MNPDMVNAAENALIPAFCSSMDNVFKTMIFMDPVCGKVVSKNEASPSGAISGTISITGNINNPPLGLAGSISLLFETEMAKTIFRSMMMMEPGQAVDDREMHDSIGEIANMIAGGAKTICQEKAIDFVIGLPTIVVGDDHKVGGPAHAIAYVVPVTTDKGSFFMELTFSVDARK